MRRKRPTEQEYVMTERIVRFLKPLGEAESAHFGTWLEDVFESRRRISREFLKERGWVVRLSGTSWGGWGPLFRRLLETPLVPKEKLLISLGSPLSGSEHYEIAPDIEQDDRVLQTVVGRGAHFGVVCTTPSRSFLIFRHHSEFSLLAGPPDFVREVTGLSLETQWRRYEDFANHGEGSEAQRRELLDLMRHYAPFNGLEDSSVSEITGRLWTDALDPLDVLEEHELPRLEARPDADGLRPDWSAGVLPMSATPAAYLNWEWSFSAERLAQAARNLGVESAKMLPLGMHRPWSFEVPMTRDGWMGFERRCHEDDYLLLPPDGSFVAVGRQERFLLFFGPHEFIDTAQDDRDVDERLIKFRSFLENTEDERRERDPWLYSGMWDEDAIYSDLLDWWETLLIERMD